MQAGMNPWSFAQPGKTMGMPQYQMMGGAGAQPTGAQMMGAMGPGAQPTGAQMMGVMGPGGKTAMRPPGTEVTGATLQRSMPPNMSQGMAGNAMMGMPGINQGIGGMPTGMPGAMGGQLMMGPRPFQGMPPSSDIFQAQRAPMISNMLGSQQGMPPPNPGGLGYYARQMAAQRPGTQRARTRFMR
jgi:hypothetical protein